jgi:hypothetical protein
MRWENSNKMDLSEAVSENGKRCASITDSEMWILVGLSNSQTAPTTILITEILRCDKILFSRQASRLRRGIQGRGIGD